MGDGDELGGGKDSRSMHTFCPPGKSILRLVFVSTKCDQLEDTSERLLEDTWEASERHLEGIWGPRPSWGQCVLKRLFFDKSGATDQIATEGRA